MQVYYLQWKKENEITQQIGNWCSKEEIQFLEHFKLAESVGFLVENTKDYVILASSICEKLCNNVIKIFKKDIIQMRKFNNAEDFSENELNMTIKDYLNRNELEEPQFDSEIKYERLPDRFKELVELYNQGEPLVSIQNKVDMNYPLLKTNIRNLIDAGILKNRQFYLGNTIFYDTKEDYERQKQELYKQVKDLEKSETLKKLSTKLDEQLNSEEDSKYNDITNPITRKIQSKTDWLKKYNVKEEELREVLRIFPNRTEAAQYLGVDKRAVSFMAIQIGERKRKYTKRCKENKLNLLDRVGIDNFLKDYYGMTNEALANKYNISEVTISRIIKIIKEKGYNVVRKRVTNKKATNPISKKVFINKKEKWFSKK